MKLSNILTQIIFIFIVVFTVAHSSENGAPERETFPSNVLFDIADQAYIVTWDTYDPESRFPRRTEQLEIDDLFFDRFMFPHEDGSYMLSTTPTTGIGVIGFQWHGKRFVDQLYIEFAHPQRIPPKNQVRLEYWIGQSVLEGQWIPLPGELIVESKGLRYLIAKNCKADSEGTFKIRWRFEDAIPSYLFTKLQALTKLQWRSTTLNIEFEIPRETTVPIQLYNARLVEPQSDNNRLLLDSSKTHNLKLNYCLHGHRKTERSIITFDFPDYPFAVAVTDVLEKGSVYVKDLGAFITTAESSMTLKKYKAQIESKQTTLEKIRRMPDQSFAEVMSKAHPAIQNRGPAMLSLACDNNKFVLREDGSISYFKNLEAPPTHRKSERGHTDEFRSDILEFIPYFGSLKPSIDPHRSWPWFAANQYPNQKRSLEDLYYPAPLNIIQADGIVYKQKTFVTPFGTPDGDAIIDFYDNKSLLVSKFTIENPSDYAKSASLKFQLINDIRTNASPPIQKVSAGCIAVSQDRLLAFIDTTDLKTLSVRLDANCVLIEGTLPPKTSCDCITYIPAWSAETTHHNSFKNYSHLLTKMEIYWNSFLSEGADIQLPDVHLTNLIKASRINCTITARNECDHANIAPWVSAAHFGIIDSESQSIIEGMSLMGHEIFAQRALDFFIRRYNDDGMLTSGYTLMGLGWHMRVLGQHFQLHRNDGWLKNNQQKISTACDWIVKQHEKTKMLTPTGEKVLEFGLMPPGTAADWPLLLYRIRPQAEFYAGLNAAAKALAQINNQNADYYLKKAEELRTDIISSYRKTQRRCPVLPISNGTFVPYCPTVVTQFGSMGDMIGSGVSVKDVSMGAQHLIALGVLPANAKDGYFKADCFEDYDFQLPCTDFPAEKIKQDWFNFAGFYRGQPYYPRITDIYALNDDVKPFIRSYFNNIVPIVNTELLTFWEHFRASGGWNKTHETGWFLQQTRMMFINEKDNDLWIAPFVPDNWMQEGMKIDIRDMPTTFGSISFEITSNVEKGVIKAVITPPTRSKPSTIIIRLRHPLQKTIKSVLVNGASHDDFDPEREIIKINSVQENISVEAHY